MTADIDKPRKILAVADTSDTQLAFVTALNMADRHGSSLEAIVCVEPPNDLSILSRLSGEDPDRLVDEAIERTRNEVSATLAKIAPERPINLHVTFGKAFLEIINHVARSDCDFVVKMAEPLAGIDRFLFASTDQHLLRKCPCPVWLQTSKGRSRPTRILAAVDLDVWDATEPETLMALNRRVVQAASLIPDSADAEIVVLHVWEAMGAGMLWAFSNAKDGQFQTDQYINEVISARQSAMDRFLKAARAEIGPKPRLVPRLVRGSPETVIHEQSRETAADVVVMGTVARTGVSGVFIGNTAENIINSLECPVLAVKPEGFVSPLLKGQNA